MIKRYQVFVSSTYTDLIEERKEATQAILKCSCFPAGMELFPASNKKQWNIIKQVIDDSDFYLLIVAGRYGSLGIDDTGKKVGYTEMEFDYALSQKKPIIVMLHSTPDTLPSKLTERTETNIKRLEKFREKAMSGRLVAFWENKDQLHSEILSSLHKMMADTPEATGWIRAEITNDTNLQSEPLMVINNFKEIVNTEDKLNYLEQLSYDVLCKCFSNRDFNKELVGLININQPSNIICRAISLFPRYRIDYKEKKFLIDAIDLNALFFAQCKDDKVQNSELSGSIISFLDILGVYSLDYSRPILNYLKAGNFSSKQKTTCIDYIGNSRLYVYGSQNEEGQNLLKYITHEIENEHRALPIDDLIDLLTIICDDDAFAEVYNIFINSNEFLQRKIIYSIFRHYGANTFLITPRIQRMFFDMCDKIYSWNDDELTADLLLYCLYTRTYDIFTADEIYEKLDEFNDDVFFLFFWQLSYGEFWSGVEENYEFDEIQQQRAVQIITERNHPRGKKLLEHVYD